MKLLFMDQIHSNVVHILDRALQERLRGDAMVTNLPFLLLVIKTADCLPVLIVDESQRVIAAIHCGWRGTCKRVVQRAIEKLKDHYECHPSSLLVALGPCIGSACYEVGEEVHRCFFQGGHPTEFFVNHPGRRGKYFFDLRGANISQMISLGVKKENIFSMDFCTHCFSDFLSYRRDKNKTGRMLSFIGMLF